MDERVVKFRVGVMVIATLFLGGILVVLFSDPFAIVRSHYVIHIHFTDAPGVTVGTPVRKSGILIGRVSSVELAQEGGVNVTCEIHNDVKIRKSEVAQVTGSLLGGDVVIQFVNQPRPPTAAPTTAPSTGPAPPAGAPPPAD
jgi:phospholipid/cholesterol/gamma-HCH transport system substrate-binding protein